MLKSTEYHKLSSSSETVSFPSLEEAVVPRPTVDGGRRGQSTARVPLPIKSPCSLSCWAELLLQAQAGHKPALMPHKFLTRLLLHGAGTWFKLLSQQIALKPSGSQQVRPPQLSELSIHSFISTKLLQTNLAPSALGGQWRYRARLCKSKDLSQGV